METLVLRPEPALKSLWHVINALIFLPVVLVLMWVLISGVEPIMMLGLLGICLVIYLLACLYFPAFYRTLEYSIDDDSIRLKKGVFWRKRTTVPYGKITNIDITQGPVERMFGISHLQIQTAGNSNPQAPKAELVIAGIRDCESLRNIIISRINKLPGSPVAAAPKDETGLNDLLNELVAIRKALEK